MDNLSNLSIVAGSGFEQPRQPGPSSNRPNASGRPAWT